MPMPGFESLAKVATKQGAATAVALALVVALIAFMRLQANAFDRIATSLDRVAGEMDALGELTVSACMPDTVAVQRYEVKRRALRKPPLTAETP